MHSWEYEIGDVLLIQRKGSEVVARVAGYVDQIDNTKPLYCNLRAVGDYAGWRRSVVKVLPSQIIKPLPTWEAERHAKYQAELTAHVDEMWAKMTPAQKERVHQDAIALGIAQPDRRSPLDIMIDRACGLE